ncbi:MAG: hypothetical protein HUU55_09775 [Myxococcales bacterium]|nr:hypothetical protein [Myxococcales bacterium]
MSNKVEEFICYRCLESFTLSADELHANNGQVICPKCGSGQSDDVLGSGETQQGKDEELPFDDEFSSTLITSIPPDVLDAVANNAALSVSDPLGTDPVRGSDGSNGGTANFGSLITSTSLPPLDPHGVNWKLKTPIGITYNFFGIDAVLNWSQSKKDLSGMAVTIDGQSEWRDFSDFRRRLRTASDPIAAFHEAVRPGEPVPVVPDPVVVPAVALDVVTPSNRPRTNVLAQEPTSSKDTKISKKVPSAKAGLTESVGNKSQPGEMPKKTTPDKSAGGSLFKDGGKSANGQGGAVPSSSLPTSSTSRTPGSFTFRVEAQPQKKPSRGFAFTLGFILGGAVVFGLWFFDILDRLPIAK